MDVKLEDVSADVFAQADHLPAASHWMFLPRPEHSSESHMDAYVLPRDGKHARRWDGENASQLHKYVQKTGPRC